ncbi:unnamed protein product [Blepharisma stoltei]|uniref:CWF21 domain-containing protein n=1 Tax=Blepharisma stoltei TaxID=1481888 RepID=A0AAU9IRI7_9CILI|nr:unnamed protein product [Blepharisma stoltei]
MYNGVGLTTPRGSGTSGYVQKNLAYIQKPTTRADFQKELAAIKANPLKPPKKPNPELIEHEQKRQIEIHLINFKKALEGQGLSPEEIKERVDNARTHLYAKLHEAPLLNQKSSHQKVIQKNEEIAKFRDSFGIKNDYVPGSSFDFEALEEKRQKEKEDRAMKKKMEKLKVLEEAQKKEKEASLKNEKAKIPIEKEKPKEEFKKPSKPIENADREPMEDGEIKSESYQKEIKENPKENLKSEEKTLEKKNAPKERGPQRKDLREKRRYSRDRQSRNYRRSPDHYRRRSPYRDNRRPNYRNRNKYSDDSQSPDYRKSPKESRDKARRYRKYSSSSSRSFRSRSCSHSSCSGCSSSSSCSSCSR